MKENYLPREPRTSISHIVRMFSVVVSGKYTTMIDP